MDTDESARKHILVGLESIPVSVNLRNTRVEQFWSTAMTSLGGGPHGIS